MAMVDQIARAELGNKPSTVTIVPSNRSLRAVERLARSLGLTTTQSRAPARLSVGLAEFASQASVLEQAGVAMDPHLRNRVHAISEMRRAQEQARARLRELDTDPSSVDDALRDLPDHDILDDHQRLAVAAIADPHSLGFCLFDEQGLGKTVTALFSFALLRRRDAIDRAVIFAPKSMVYEWIHDLSRFFRGRYAAEAIVGSAAEKRAACDRRADVYVTNIDTATSLAVRLRQLVEAGPRTFLIIDESFLIKNPDARRTRALRPIRDCAARVLVLCGTPAPNSPIDVVEQFNIADAETTFGGIVIPDDSDEARRVIARTMEQRGLYLRRLKSDVLALPARRFTRIRTPMQPVQHRIYTRLLRALIDDLRDADDAAFKREMTSFAARRAALLQTCSHPGAVVDDYTELPAKILALESLLGELIGQRREKVVLWSFFRHSIEAIVRHFEHFGVVRYDGTVTDAEARRNLVWRFQTDDATMLFVGNPAAAGAGITLHRARYAIFESFSNQAAHYLQSLDRIHRRGQEREVEYLVLLCAEAIDEHEYERLTQKQQSAAKLLGDNAEHTWTRTAMLGEATDAARAIGLLLDNE